MTSVRKLERDRTLAELASIESLLGSMTDEDVMTRSGLEERRLELQEEVAGLLDFEDGTASAVLFFGGKPVLGSQGIESEFGGTAVAKFQDLVAKLLVQEIGELGQRGPVPNKAASTMHITNIMRGSFGFLMEEMQPQGQLVDTALKLAVNHASQLMVAFGDLDEEKFQEAVERVDQRVLATATEFFDLVHQNNATFRIVAGERDSAFALEDVERAVQRAIATSIEEAEEALFGQLIGVLPESHMFEFRSEAGEVIQGRVDQAITTEQLMRFNHLLLEVDALARLKVRRVSKDNEVVRQGYTLLSLAGRGEEQPLLDPA